MTSTTRPAIQPATAAWDNPMGTDGFEFIEFFCPCPVATEFGFGSENHLLGNDSKLNAH